MENHPIENLMITAMNSIKDMVDADTIIGKPIQGISGTVIIPISKVGFGFASGGSEFKDEVVDTYEKEERNEKIKYKNPFGGGAGAGVNIVPIGFLVVSAADETPRFIPVEHTCSIDKIIDYIPDLFDKKEKIANRIIDRSDKNIEEY